MDITTKDISKRLDEIGDLLRLERVFDVVDAHPAVEIGAEDEPLRPERGALLNRLWRAIMADC